MGNAVGDARGAEWLSEARWDTRKLCFTCSVGGGDWQLQVTREVVPAAHIQV